MSHKRLREEQARESATVDQLTGLFNRNHGKNQPRLG